MKRLGVNEIREAYLSFFESKGHLRLPSFSLVPKNDPSILLINAGMTPMKAYFRGDEKPPRTRVTTCQKCIRTPDIERVGLTSRHGTFFEMLGNFSFGDYFKAEVIPWAWEFLTKVLEIPKDILYVTIYEKDDEAYDIWTKKVGIDPTHVFKMSKADNFWEHGTGPCGPDSEIFVDRGPQYGKETPQQGIQQDIGDRYVEIWNLVFTQFEHQADGTYAPLKQRNIDTGAGLERVATILQGVDNLFEVDTVRAVLDKVCEIAGKKYGENERDDISIRVITDHIRSTTMMIADGITPSNEGRGYVLRRLLRRASRCGRLLNIKRLFLTDLADVVIKCSGSAYPELIEHRDFIMATIEAEEKRFDQTVAQGLDLLQQTMNEVKKNKQQILPGDVVFKLHDTYGFPVDLTAEIAHENKLDIDRAGFDRAMQVQKERAREARRAKSDSSWIKSDLAKELKEMPASIYTCYEKTSDEGVLQAIIVDDHGSKKLVNELTCTADPVPAYLIFNQTPYFAENGGQIGDSGMIGNSKSMIQVNNCTKTIRKVYIHDAVLQSGTIKVGDKFTLTVDKERREKIRKNHTATHLLHAALREKFGKQLVQSGSFVGPDYLRFDFNHPCALTTQEIREIEERVNWAVMQDWPVQVEFMNMDEANKRGAIHLFDEKYEEKVRVVTMTDYSVELCGGTHLGHTSQVGFFRIVAETSAAAGIRRIDAVTGPAAYQLSFKEHDELAALSAALKAPSKELLNRVAHLQEQVKNGEKKLHDLEQKMLNGDNGSNLAKEVQELGGVKLLLLQVSVGSIEALRELADNYRNKLNPAVVMLFNVNEGKLQLICMISKELTNKGLNAVELIKTATTVCGGGGGGRPDMAQAGGKDIQAVPEAIKAVRQKLTEKL